MGAGKSKETESGSKKEEEEVAVDSLRKVRGSATAVFIDSTCLNGFVFVHFE